MPTRSISRRIHAKTTGKVDGHCDFGVRRESPRRYAPMGCSLAPVRVAGITWNSWQPSAVYAASTIEIAIADILKTKKRRVSDSVLDKLKSGGKKE